MNRCNGVDPTAHRLFLIGVLAALLVLVSTAAPLVADGVNAEEGIERNIKFRRISLEEGLSQAFVNSIVQDRRGFMWFATQEGLNLYDGHTFTVFAHDSDDRNSVSHDLIKVLIEDTDGILWLGTDGGGLNRFDPVTKTVTRFMHDPEDPTSIGSDRVWALLEDHAGRLWVGTDDAGVYLLDRETLQFTPIRHDPEDGRSLSDDRVRDLAEDPAGAVWVATEGGGLNRFDPATGRFEHYRHEPDDPLSVASDRVRDIMVDSAGAVWVGTYDRGLDRLDLYRDGFAHYRHDSGDPRSLAADGVRTVYEGRDGTVWVGTHAGLSRYLSSSDDFQTLTHDPTDTYSLSHDRVVSIYEDRGGVLWVGTFSGLNTWNTSTGLFIHYRQTESDNRGLSNAYISAFAEDPSGDIWIGTYGGGLNRFHRETKSFTYLRHDGSDPSTISDDRVMSLLVDSSGTLWAGTFGAGLERYDAKTDTFTHYRHDPDDPTSLSWNGVTVLLEDRDGVLWVGTYKGGLNRFDPRTGTFKRFRNDSKDPSSLSSDRILGLYEDSLGNLWVGTYGAGLNLLDRKTGRFSVIRQVPGDFESLSKDDLLALFEDSRGNLWIGTQGGGMNRWSLEDRKVGRARFTRITTREGLPSNTINSFLEDEGGNIWVSTNSGLSRLSPDTGTITSFDTSHGLQGEFNYGAGLQTRDGYMFFGGIHGFNVFRAARIIRNHHVPPVVITRVLKLDEPIQVEGGFELEHDDAMLTIEFAGLDYTAPERNRYRYKLQGFDKDWVERGGSRRATYTNLPPGSYEFKVMGSNSDGLWNENATSISFSVGSPWWRTWWAYSLYALTFGLVVQLNARSQAKKRHRAQELAAANQALQLEIEQRKLQGEALRLEKERAQRYLDVAEVIMLVVDTAGVVTLVNQKGAEVLGYSEEEILGKEWASFVRPDQRSLVEEFLRKDTSGDYFEYSVIDRAGEERIVAWHMTFLRDEDKRIIGTLSSGSDVTQMLRLRAEKESAESASRAKSQFLANMSHEIRTPMNGVLGMIELLLHSGLDDRQTHFADNAHRAARTLLDLLNDILDLSKIEAGKLDLETIEFAPRALLEDVMMVFIQQARQDGLRLTSTVEDDVPEALVGDPVRLRQVLSNLVGNAIKFTENGGVAIAAKVLNNAKTGKRLRYEVRDTGVGLAAHTAKTIFEPFQQADGSTTRRFGGTGLGLTITRQLVELMGGTLGVESVEGAGSLFWFEIPLNGNARVQKPDPETTGSPTSGKEREGLRQAISAARILLVEDNSLNQEVVRGMLEHLGGHADVAASGQQALNLFKRGVYELVLMDCQMPDMDGYEATRRIRDLESQWIELGINSGDPERPSRVPVVAMTASALAGDRERCLDAGMDDYLGKPFTMDQLRRFLEKWLPIEGLASAGGATVGEAVWTTGPAARQAVDRASAASEDRAGGPDGEPLDRAALDEIRKLERSGATGIFDKIINIYMESSPELVDAITTAAQNGDSPGLHVAAHSLKSTSASLGARHLASLCRHLEEMGQSGEIEVAPAVADSLIVEFERVRGALADELRREAV